MQFTSKKIALLTDCIIATSESRIFTMGTVVIPHTIMRTIKERKLSSSTEEVIQENRASSLSKWSLRQSNSTCPIIILRIVAMLGIISLLLCAENPSCLQATAASLALQKSSQTVPQALLEQTSTRPSLLFLPFISLMDPVTQTVGIEDYIIISDPQPTYKSTYWILLVDI